MKLITQRGETDCGLACLAMVSGKTLDDVVNTLGLEGCHENDRCRTKSTAIKKFANELGYNQQLSMTHCEHWNQITSLSIVGVNRDEDKKHWHWVVFDPADQKIYDPNPKVKNQIRKADGRTKPFWFLTFGGQFNA